MTDDSVSIARAFDEGDFVIVQKVGGEHVRVCRLKRKEKMLIEKLRFVVDGAIGQPPGLFEVREGGRLQSADVDTLVAQDGRGDIELNCASTCSTSTPSAISPDMEEDGGDNLADSPSRKRQRVTQEQIADMKVAGVGSSQLVTQLVAGNSSFADRTTYSQAKYIRRKTRKHTDRVLILRPTIRLLCEAHYRKDPEKVANLSHQFHLRVDQLGLVLSLGNVYAGSHTLLLEQCQGLVTAAVLDRLRGRGSVIHLHKGMVAQAIPGVHAMMFDQRTISSFHTLQLQTLLNNGPEKKPEMPAASNGDTVCEMENGSEADGNDDGDGAGEMESESGSTPISKALARWTRECDTWNRLQTGPIDTVIVAVRTLSIVDVLRMLTPFLRLAGTVVVYSPYCEALVAGYRWLKQSNAFVNMQLVDSFFRHHQVLPDRTHPVMQQNVAGGFVLSAIKVQASPVSTAASALDGEKEGK